MVLILTNADMAIKKNVTFVTYGDFDENTRDLIDKCTTAIYIDKIHGKFVYIKSPWVHCGVVKEFTNIGDIQMDFYEANHEKDKLIGEFIEKQKLEIESHKLEIGYIGRFMEKLFGSSFYKQKEIEYQNFLETL